MLVVLGLFIAMPLTCHGWLVDLVLSLVVVWFGALCVVCDCVDVIRLCRFCCLCCYFRVWCCVCGCGSCDFALWVWFGCFIVVWLLPAWGGFV